MITGKIDLNKKQKKNALLQTAFELFTDKGFTKTTIADIAAKSGLAKGTFYLYFKDKYDLRDRLIASKAGQLLADAHEELTQHPVEGFENQLIAVVDYVVGRLEKNPELLKFISKNLSWGVFKNAFERTVPEDTQQFYSYYLELMEKSRFPCKESELLLFTILELVGSTCYSCILDNQPVSMDKYMSYLHQSIRQILCAFAE